jgi:putative transposase
MDASPGQFADHPPDQAQLTTRDKGLAETINGLYKTELIKPRKPWRTIEDLEVSTAAWVHWFNHHRLYEYCGDIPPIELETAYYAQQRRPAAG